jgi:hypothetical protein
MHVAIPAMYATAMRYSQMRVWKFGNFISLTRLID